MKIRYVVKLRKRNKYGKPEKWQYCNSFGWDSRIRTWESKEQAERDIKPYVKDNVEYTVIAITTTD